MSTQDPIAKALADRPRRSGIPTSTGVLAAIMLLAAGFFGGLLVGRHTSSGQTGPAAGGFPGGFPTPGASGAFGRPGGNPLTIGTVTRIEGDTVYLKTVDGRTVKVVTSGDTQIRVSKEGTLQDLSTGSTVVVQGSESGQGVVEATSIAEGGLGAGVPMSGGTSGSAG